MAPNHSVPAAPLAKSGNDIAAKAKVFWARLSSRQRLSLGAGVAVTAAVCGLCIKLIVTPAYKPVMTGLEASDAQAIVAQLAEKNIPARTSPDGTVVSVPASQVDAARLEVAAHDSPRSGRIGFEIFDKTSWGQTEFDEKVNYQRALEGELERTIQTLRNVKSARVHLVMADNSVFTDQDRSAKASVALQLRSGTLSRTEAQQIARLVSGAVEGLDPKDVVIVDADSNRSLGTDADGDDSDSLDQQLTRRLVATLTPVVGADNLRATVNVEYETGSTEENAEKYDPEVSAVLSMQRSEENSGPNGSIGGVPGTSSNLPSPKKPPAQSSTVSGPSTSSESATYGVNKTTRHTIEPAGGIRRITAALVLDDAVERTWKGGHWVTGRRKWRSDEIQNITSLAQAAIGFNSTRGDVVTVQNLSFDHPAVDDTGAVSVMDRTRKELDDFAPYIRYATLLVLFVLVYLLTIRPIQKKVLAAPVEPPSPALMPAPEPGHIESKPTPALATAASTTQRSLAIRKEVAEFVRTEPESSMAAIRMWLNEEKP
jgi:flagellar M-ring protein FliF